MIDPMMTRLAGCLIFASLFGALLMSAMEPYEATSRDVVKVAELNKSVEKVLLTRQ